MNFTELVEDNAVVCPGWSGRGDCEGRVDYLIKIPDGRTNIWRKAWGACAGHLEWVISMMEDSYGYGMGTYKGNFVLRARAGEEGMNRNADGENAASARSAAGDQGQGVPGPAASSRA